MAWKTVWSALVGRPCCLRVRKANNICAQAASKLSMCSATEKRRLMVMPSALIDSKPATAGGSTFRAHLLLGDLLGLRSVQLQIVDISPQLDICNFRCTRLYTGCRYNKISVVCIFMHRVACSDWVQIGHVGSWTDSRAFNNVEYILT